MKKIVILWLVLLFVLVPVMASAEEATDTEIVDTEIVDTDSVTDDVVVDEVVVPSVDVTEEDLDAEPETLFTRMFEFVDAHRQMIVMCIGFIFSIAIAVKDGCKQKKTNVASDEKQSNILSGVNGVVSSQNGVIDAVNQLSIGYERMKTAYERYESVEDDRNKLVGAVMIQTATVLDIMASVYVNSNHLPQGEKDIILLKYSKCLAAMEDDEKLRECMRAVQNILGKDAEKNEAIEEGDTE